MSRFGIIWFEKYASPHPILPFSRKMATDFANTLKGRKLFEYGDGQAIPGTFNTDVEKVHLLYFVGHGTAAGPVVDLGARTLGPAAVRLGTGDLAYAALDCCRVLDPAYRTDWHPAFDGLHYLLGFSDTVWQSETRGQRFAQHLNDGVEIAEAWRRAAIETQGEKVPWAFVRAVHDGAVADNLTWSIGRRPQKDPERPLAFLHRSEKSEVMVHPPSRAARVRLFRTPPQPVTEAHREGFAAMFNMGASLDESLRDHSLELQGRGMTLELYEASGAFWLRRNALGGFELDRPLPEAPSAGEAMERSRDYLREKHLMNGTSGQLASETEEEQYERDESGEGYRLRRRRTVARHVSHTHSLEGLPVFGPGAKIRVSYEGGEVSELAYFRRKTVPEGRTVPVLNRDQAVARLKDEVFKELPKESVTVDEVHLGYYALPPREEQDYLLPAYELKGRVNLDGLTYDFIRYMQAVPEASRPAQSSKSVFHRPTFFT
jgi:hypothetical protein